MTFSMQANQHVTVALVPLDAGGNPALGTLSGVVAASSDETIFTVGEVTGDNTAVVTGVAAGTANLTYTGTATEPDGTQHQVSGATTIVLGAVIPQVASIGAVFGTPEDN